MENGNYNFLANKFLDDNLKNLLSGRCSYGFLQNSWIKYVDKIYQLRYMILLPCTVADRMSQETKWAYSASENVIRNEPGLDPDSEIFKEKCDAIVCRFRETEDPTKKVDSLKTNISQFMSHYSQEEFIREGVHALFNVAVIEAYGAFEILAGELWVLLVNNASSNIKDKVFQSVPDAKNARVLQLIKKHKYDVGKKVGDVMKASECVGFQSLDNIFKAYKLLGNKDILGNLDTGAEIRLVAAVRNIFVHNRGCVDPTFTSQVRAFTEYRELPEGTDLNLSGEQFYHLFRSSLVCANKLYALINEIALADGIRRDC